MWRRWGRRRDIGGMMLTLVAVFAGLLGLVIGSFLNVVVYRVPAGLSIAHPPSACPHCGHRIAWYDNIPVLSWLLLGAKCRNCRAPISVRYPIVEALTAAAFVGVALCFAPGGWLAGPAAGSGGGSLAQSLVLVAYLWFAGASIALAAIDLDVKRLPDPIVWSALVVLVLFLAAAAAIRGDLAAILVALVCGAAMGAFYFLVFLLAPRGGMGFGDVKLSLAVGVATGWIGWQAAVVGWFAAFLLGGLVGVGLLLVRRAGRRTAIPFGPWMLLGAWIGIVVGPWAWTWYSGLVGLA